jgi:hypothetical protein
MSWEGNYERRMFTDLKQGGRGLFQDSSHMRLQKQRKPTKIISHEDRQRCQNLERRSHQNTSALLLVHQLARFNEGASSHSEAQ